MSGNESWWAECQAVSIGFANGIDHRRYDDVAALFAEDGVLDRWGQQIVGRPALRQWLDTRPLDVVTRHACTNFDARKTGPETAEGFTLFAFYRGTGQDNAGVLPLTGPDLVGEYLDQFRLTSEGWRIAKREIRIVFQRAS